MYGLVNRAIEQMVVSLAGEDAWQRVCERAGTGHDGFVAMCPYHDDVTYGLVGAVSEEMAMPPHEVLQAFGEYWILYTADEGYGELMQAGGRNLREFLANLNDMHGRVETVFPEMRLPQFRVEDEAEGTYLLHYTSSRQGLAPMVLGLVHGLARRFGQTVQVRQLASRGGEAPADVFRIVEQPGAA